MSNPNNSETPNLAPVRRVVTGHSPDGRSIIIEDAPIEPHLSFPGSKSLSSDIYWTTEHVPDNDIVFKDHAKEHARELVGPAGNSFKVIDMPPGQKSPLHRTVTLDYAILTHGQLSMTLNHGKRITLKAGDVLIQRGTLHSWHNDGTEWARLYCIVIPSQKVKVGDRELEQVFLVDQDKLGKDQK